MSATSRFLSFYDIALFDPLTLGGMALGAVGSGISAAGTLAGGKMAKQASQFEAAQLTNEGQTAVASSQRTMQEQQRKTGLVQSTLQARAAASGAGATDPTVLQVGQQIAGRGEQNSLMDLFEGQNRQSQYAGEAEGRLYSGEAAEMGSELGAAGTIAGGIGGMFQKFGAARGAGGLRFGSGGSALPDSSSVGYPTIAQDQMYQ